MLFATLFTTCLALQDAKPKCIFSGTLYKEYSSQNVCDRVNEFAADNMLAILQREQPTANIFVKGSCFDKREDYNVVAAGIPAFAELLGAEFTFTERKE